VPSLLFDASKWSIRRFIEYDSFILAPALVQFLHRLVAYILTGLIIYYGVRVRRLKTPLWYRRSSFILILALMCQLVLGIFTVINCRGVIPLVLGVMHQAGAIILISCLLFMMFVTKKE